jgi:hypothetical protein
MTIVCVPGAPFEGEERSRFRRLGRENGAALVVAILCMLLVAALAAALLVTTASETMIAANYRNAGEAREAADAVLERALGDLPTAADWSPLLAGAAVSGFVDGAAGGARILADGSTLDLSHVQNLANCNHAAVCSGPEMDAVTADRPWGSNNPRWQLYAYGPLASLQPGSINSPFYVVALVAYDPSENDDNPLADGASPCAAGELPVGLPPSCNPGSGVLEVRGEAFGPRGVHRTVSATIARTAPSTLRVLSWREMR